jgi:hypothetical protein
MILTFFLGFPSASDVEDGRGVLEQLVEDN